MDRGAPRVSGAVRARTRAAGRELGRRDRRDRRQPLARGGRPARQAAGRRPQVGDVEGRAEEVRRQGREHARWAQWRADRDRGAHRPRPRQSHRGAAGQGQGGRVSDLLADLEALLKGLTPEAKAALDKDLEAEFGSAWLPNPGPQTQALESPADILLYGGAAGGGKTDLLLGAALTRHERTVIFRRAFVDLKGIEQRLFEIAGRDGWNGQDHALTRP